MALGAVLVVALVAVIITVGAGGGDELTADAPTSSSSTASTAESTSTTGTTVPETTSTTAPPPAIAEVPETVPPTTAPPTGFTLDPYRGFGAWVDVFDWTVEYDRSPGDPPAVGEAEIDHMASLGVRTLYFQPARYDSAAPGVLEPARANAIIDRAHSHGMAVVGWYLPTMEDPAYDLAQLTAVGELPIDGLGVDIESVRLADEAERNRRIVQLSADLRAAHPGEVLSAIVLPPVVTEIYGTYWGGFPWAELAPYYDVWQPMGYWTNRPVASGWRDAYTYTAANIDLLRQETGLPNAVVHPVGGIGCCEGPTAPTTPADIEGMVRAAAERGAVGASIYDYVTTTDDLWAPLQATNGL